MNRWLSSRSRSGRHSAYNPRSCGVTARSPAQAASDWFKEGERFLRELDVGSRRWGREAFPRSGEALFSDEK